MNPNGITYALIIAVENYNQSKNFKKVSYASNDAEDLFKALIKLELDKDNIKCLIDKDATFTAINTEVKNISKRTTDDDRIIIFFAGHGAFVDEENRIIPVDAYMTNLKETSITISSILGHLKKSSSKRNLLFFDCCHSGFEPGDIVRDISTDFLSDELMYNYRNEEYCCGFASSKSDQKSISSPILKNGVWSHFLIKALSGDAGNIYEHGILFSDKLQSYLNKEVFQFVKMNSTKKREQTPIVFGNQTDRFTIANLNSVFDERESNKKISEISFTNITLISEENGSVKTLPDFKKGYHKVPTSSYSGADSFIKDCGKQLVTDEINELGEAIRKDLKYKRKQVEAWTVGGSGAIVTPDFTYSMEIYQSNFDPSEYVLERKLEGFSQSERILEDDLNSIFSYHFDQLQFELPEKINVEDLIDLVEGLGDEIPVTVNYNPANTPECTLSILGLNYDILVTPDSITIKSNHQTSPVKLISAYKETHKVLLANPNLKILGK
jgi:hypothetical protein